MEPLLGNKKTYVLSTSDDGSTAKVHPEDKRKCLRDLRTIIFFRRQGSFQRSVNVPRNTARIILNLNTPPFQDCNTSQTPIPFLPTLPTNHFSLVHVFTVCCLRVCALASSLGVSNSGPSVPLRDSHELQKACTGFLAQISDRTIWSPLLRSWIKTQDWNKRDSPQKCRSKKQALRANRDGWWLTYPYLERPVLPKRVPVIPEISI